MTDLIERLETATGALGKYLVALVVALIVMLVLTPLGVPAFLIGWLSATGWFITLDNIAAFKAHKEATT